MAARVTASPRLRIVRLCCPAAFGVPVLNLDAVRPLAIAPALFGCVADLTAIAALTLESFPFAL